MLTAHRPDSMIASRNRAVFAMQTSTSGGLSETDVTELAVIATSSPFARVVMTQTPVARQPIASRRVRGVTGSPGREAVASPASRAVEAKRSATVAAST